jgi:hypothetical protein
MKLMMILGGFIGFLMGLVMGAMQHCAWQGVIWRASVVALLTGIVFRWWARIWIRGFVQAYQQRHTPPAPPNPQPAQTEAKP